MLLLTFVLIFIFGALIRVISIEKRIYWADEVYTALWISGHTEQEIIDTFYHGGVTERKSILNFQKPDPDKTIFDTVSVLSHYDPQHPPAYYVLAHMLADTLGDAKMATRLISAVFGSLCVGLMYLVGREIFKSAESGVLAALLFAISPFHILYAQEARPYALWTFCVLLSSYALLRVLRRPTRGRWLVYALSMIFSLYTFLLSALVWFGHALFVILSARNRTPRRIKEYVVTSLAVLIAFMPWIMVVMTARLEGKINRLEWVERQAPWPLLLSKWLLNLDRLFFDWIEVREDSRLQDLVALIPVTAFVTGLVIYAIYYCAKNCSRPARIFLGTMTLTLAAALIVPDLLWGGRRSGIARYMIPTLLGLQLVVAHLLARQTTTGSAAKRLLWGGVVGLVVVGSIASNFAMLKAESWWWTKGSKDAARLPLSAHLIDSHERPLVISDADFTQVFSLVHRLKRNADFQLVHGPQLFVDLARRPAMFLYKPSDALINGFSRDYELENLVQEETSPRYALYRLRPRQRSTD